MQPFVHRRTQLQNQLNASDAFLIRQPKPVIRNDDVHYPFHPDRYFYYLLGFEEPDAWLLITKKSTYLWSPGNSDRQKVWDGALLAENSPLELQVDHWEDLQNLKNTLPNHLKQIQNLFLIGSLPSDIVFDGAIHDGRASIDQMRMIKDHYEIQVIQEACRISSLAHNHLMSICKTQQNEADLMGAFLHETMKQGGFSQAYPPIVASGKNALTLHYIKNNCALSKNELILVDAGCEFQQYASDITRTFPANGVFSKKQQALYEAVLDTQLSTIELIKPNITLTQLHEHAVLSLTQHLVDLKIIKTSYQEAIETKSYLQYFPHRIGHTLGLNVHDIPATNDTLSTNMIITIEPGLYIHDHPDFNQMGIRIEDNILVTETGYKNLTDQAYKQVSDIQKTMS